MDTTFMSSKNSKTSDPRRLLLNLSDKINLKRSDEMLLYQTLAFTKHGKILKSHTKIIKLKYQFQHGMKILNTWWIKFCIRYSTLLWLYLKKYGENTHNSSIENRK